MLGHTQGGGSGPSPKCHSDVVPPIVQSLLLDVLRDQGVQQYAWSPPVETYTHMSTSKCVSTGYVWTAGQQQLQPPCPFRPETRSPAGAIIRYRLRILSNPCTNVFLYSLVKTSLRVCVCKPPGQKSFNNHMFWEAYLGVTLITCCFWCTFTKLNH